MDTILIATIAILGIADSWIDRITGRGILARLEDWIAGTEGGER